MESAPCTFNSMESDIITLSDYLLKSSNPPLSSLVLGEETADELQLTLIYQSDNLLSNVDVKFNNDSTYTIPNDGSCVIDSSACPSIDAEDSLGIPDSRINLKVESSSVEIIPSDTTDNEIIQIDSEEKYSSDVTPTCLPEVELKESSAHENSDNSDSEPDIKGEMTIALQSVGITKGYFMKSSGSRKQLWSCPLVKCSFNTVKLDTFKLHLLKHFGMRPFKCKYSTDNGAPCTWAFYSRSKLQRHEIVHTKEKHWMCEYKGCHKKFSSKTNMKCHLVRHEKAQEHHCPLVSCNESFNTMSQYHAHMKEHTELPATHKCEYTGCNKSFYSVSALQSHGRLHMKDPADLRCQLCDRTFKAPCRLKAHYNEVHGNIRKFKCSFQGCKWAFATKSKLNRHMNSSAHLNNKMFTCSKDNCGKSFLRPEHLKEHVNSHLVDRPKFSCSHEHCNLTFFAKSSLYFHLKHEHSFI